MADKKLADFVKINKSLVDSSTLSITKHIQDKLKPAGKIRLSDKLDARQARVHNF